MSSLVVVTEDGYAKRVPMEDIPQTRRGTKGRLVSSASVAAVVTVDDLEGDLVVATARGKVERVAVRSIPARRREVKKGRVSKGARVVALDAGDRVASAAVATDDPAQTVETPAQSAPAPLRGADWPHGRVGLREGERVGSCVVFGPLVPLEEIRPGGKPAVPREEWATTAIHAASRYWCGHCGQEREDPEAVYACIDAHAAAARFGAGGEVGVDKLAEAA